jgi:ABC-2 type transport system ATP-binding protein
MDVILTEGLTKRFGRRTAVADLSLSVGAGEVFGLLGPNGAGKTTTIGMLLALVRPSGGRAVVLGHDVQREPALALRGVGAMVEAPAFYPYLSARDNLRVLARAGGLPEARVGAALAAVDLVARARDRFRSFSQGMKQRLGIAAALLPDPALLILDEPTNGLDPAGQREIRALIAGLASRGRTIVLCSHLLHEVEQLCDRVAILNRGRLVALGRVDELLRRDEGLLVRIAGDPAPALEALRGVPWVRGAALEHGALLVDAPADRAAELNALLVAGGVAVAEIRARERRLEDVFLQLTGDGEAVGG